MRVGEVEEAVRILREENARLAEGQQDALLLGLIAEQLQGIESFDALLAAGLEEIARVKELPFCAAYALDGAMLRPLGVVVRPGAPPAVPAILPAPGPLRDELVHGVVLDAEACAAAGLGRDVLAPGFTPTAAILVPFSCRRIGRGAFLFAHTLTDAALGRHNLVLSRAVETIAARADTLDLLAELRDLNAHLDATVERRTRELTEANRALAREIAERRRTEEVVARTQRLESLAILAGGIAHDFNNLLTGILTNVSLARADSAGEVEEMLADAEGAARRARGLTQQLLTFARGGAPVRRVVALGPVIREAAEFCTHGSSATCRLDLPPELWPCDADAGQLGQVVQNLVLNAIDAMKGVGAVEILAGNEHLPRANPHSLPQGPYVRVSVADHGSGIPADLLDRIFDPFFTTKKKGSGLGLSVCHAIVARHGGALAVASKPGEGARFDVFLPALPGRLAETERTASAPGALLGRVLVMDDDGAVLRAAARALRVAGCTVTTASEGEEAVRLFQRACDEGLPFEVVILDLTVPGGMGGAAAWRAMHPIDPRALAVASSGYSSDPVMSEHVAHGFAGVLPKPYGPPELRKLVGEMLVRARRS